MKIAVDKNQFAGSHGKSNKFKHEQLQNVLGATLVPTPLPFGDYCLITDVMQETIDRRGDKLKKQDLVGDIKVSVDTKKDLLEVCGNICSSSHNRIRDEIILSQKCGCTLYILVENTDGIKSIDDVFKWHNPRLDIWVQDKSKILGYYKNGNPRYARKQKYPRATKGPQLAKTMLSMQYKYDVKFEFCKPSESGKRILELLTGECK